MSGAPTHRAFKAAVDMEIHFACRIQTIGIARALDGHFPGYDDMRDALIAARHQLVTLGGDLPNDPTGIIHNDPIQAAVLTVIDAAVAKAEGRS